MKGKIILEEHISTEENNQLWDSTGEGARNGRVYMADIERRLPEAEVRLKEMDQFGIESMVLSLTSPGVQSILEANLAVDVAKRTNEIIAKHFIEPHKGRFYGFATVALQKPKKAAEELERAVKQLGFVGALINGYTNVEDHNSGQYLDEEPIWEFWDRVAQLDVPVYLHPREPLPAQQAIYKGYSSLVGSAWGFAHETGTHAVRLMMSGLFDTYADLKIILGHLGEGLSQLLPRLDARLELQREGSGLGKAMKKPSEYFSRNFYVTTSGHFHTKALLDSLSEIGSDRVLFSVDYPYEYLETGATWFDSALLSDNDRVKIGRENARRLLRLS